MDDRLKKKKRIIWIVVIAGLVVLGVVLLIFFDKGSPEPRVKKALDPYVESALDTVKQKGLLSDLSYQIQLKECQEFEYSQSLYATGDVVLLSDEIEKQYGNDPATMYEKMKEIGDVFFGELLGADNQKLKIDDITFSCTHGTGYSKWRTSAGTEYAAAYYVLEKNGEIIYDDPENDPVSEEADQQSETSGDSGKSDSKKSDSKNSTTKPSGKKKSDDLGASNYTDPDDFYEDYFYEFEDYDEAEQYWDENH